MTTVEPAEIERPPVSSPMVIRDAAGHYYSLSDHWQLASSGPNASTDLLPSPAQAFEFAAHHRRLGNLLLTELADVLREHLGRQGTEALATVAMGPFVRAFVEALSVRRMLVESALRHAKPPAVLTTALSRGAWRTPRSSKEFMALARNSMTFNRQLFTMIGADLDLIGASPPGTGPPSADDMRVEDVQPRNSRWGLPTCRRSGTCRHIHCASNLFPLPTAIALILLTGTSLRRPSPPRTRSVSTRPDTERRRTELAERKVTGEIGRLWPHMATLLPLTIFEELPLLIDGASRQSIPRAHIGPIPSSDPQHVSLALLAQRNVPLYLVQHGGFYGETVPKPSEIHERSVSTAYLTWGWEDGEDCRPMPAPRLLSRFRSTRRPAKGRTGESAPEVHWITQDLWPLDYRLPPVARGVTAYVQNCECFRSALSAETMEVTQVRSRPLKRNVLLQDIARPERREFQGLVQSDPQTRIDEVLRRADLIVLDCAFTTTFLECLSSDVPVVLFDPIGLQYVRPSIAPIYRELAAIDVVHTDPIRAAQTVNLHHTNAHDWWHETSRQAVLQHARSHLARTAPAAVRNWRDFFTELRRTSPRAVESPTVAQPPPSRATNATSRRRRST